MLDGFFVLMHLPSNRRHPLSHIHVRYQGEQASVSIEPGDAPSALHEAAKAHRATGRIWASIT